MEKELFFVIVKEDEGKRIDKYLGSKLSLQFSRTSIKKFIQEENVFLNGKAVKPHHKLKENDEITVRIVEPVFCTRILPVKIQLNIIYEDEFLLVVNKPAGMVVHPAAGHFNDTLVNALLFHSQQISDLNGPLKQGIVHRLDKDTSGVLVVAKDNKVHQFLANQFKQHLVKKVYLAVVKGRIEYDEGVIDAPISRSPFNRKKMSVFPVSSKQAQTCYRVIRRGREVSLLEIYPKTGRTHQIRVHLAHIGHPILGDKCYGKNSEKAYIQRQALHAKILGFIHPQTKNFMEFEAPLPIDMLNLINSDIFG